MPEFRVRYSYTIRESDYVIVEAENEDEAERFALDEIWEDDVEIYSVEEY